MNNKIFEHPEYALKKDNWKIYDELYKGDRNVILQNPSYLVPHDIEISGLDGAVTLLARRIQRTQYTNQLTRIFKRFQGLFFSNDIAIDPELAELFQEFNQAEYDIDGTGQSLKEFIKNDLLLSRFLFGRVFILVDSTEADQIETVEQRKLSGKRPFFKCIQPLDLKDWQISTSGLNLGKPESFRFNYTEVKKRESLLEEPKELNKSKYYQLLENNIGVVEFELKGEQILKELSSKVLPISQIPLAAIWKGESYIKDVVPHVLKYLNYDSCIANILNHQGHRDIYISGNNNRLSTFTGEQIYKYLPEGAQVTVVDPSDPTALRAERDKAEADIYKAAFNLNRVISSESKEIEAADSLEKQREDLKNMVVAELQELEDCTNQAIEFFKIFAGQPNNKGWVTFDKNISVENVDQFLQHELALEDELKQIPELKKAVAKKHIEKLNLSNEDEIFEKLEQLNYTTTNPAQTALNDILENV